MRMGDRSVKEKSKAITLGMNVVFSLSPWRDLNWTNGKSTRSSFIFLFHCSVSVPFN